MFLPLRLAPAARRLSAEALIRCSAVMVTEVRTDQTRLELERASMELSDEESSLAALSEKFRQLSATNADLDSVNKKLQLSLDKLKHTSTDISFNAELGIARYWSGLFSQSNFFDSEIDYSNIVKAVVTLPTAGGEKGHIAPGSLVEDNTAEVKEASAAAPDRATSCKQKITISEESDHLENHDIPLRSLSSKWAHDAEIGGLFTHMADLSEKDTMEVQCKIDSTLRKAAELQRQRAERMQEIADLQLKLAPLRAAAATKRAGRQLSSVHCRLRRIEDILSCLVGGVREEMEQLEEWMRSVEVRMAWLLEALGAPPDARRAWLKEAIGKLPNDTAGLSVSSSQRRLRSLSVSSENDLRGGSLKASYVSKMQPEFESWAVHSQRPLQEQEEQVQNQLQRAISEQHGEALLERKYRSEKLDIATNFDKIPLRSEYDLAAQQVHKEEERQGLYSDSVNRMLEVEQQLWQQQVQLQNQQESEVQQLRRWQEQEFAVLDQQLPFDQQPLDHYAVDVQVHKDQIQKKILQQQNALQRDHQQQLQQVIDLRKQHEHTLQQQQEMQQQHFEYLQELKRDLLVKAGEQHVKELFSEPEGNKIAQRSISANHGLAVGAGPLHHVNVENATEEEILAALRDALALFCPKLPGSSAPRMDGSRALWSLLAKLATLSAYVQSEFSEVGRAAVQVDHRREQSVLADSRHAKEQSFAYELQEKLPTPPLASTIPPYAVG
eukprot:TRINITY_DN27297_c0_g1_i1.p1 TRINITY_DN27297_c0_g1~~TRINITY_DN27297_c0_g1_i1.p1  ORF type:complete len:797 (-),score=202.69 TRINITY_DN27297_c0_g1_i1:123-2294(-)